MKGRAGPMGMAEASVAERPCLFGCAYMALSLSTEASEGCRAHGELHKWAPCLRFLTPEEKNAMLCTGMLKHWVGAGGEAQLG